MKQKNVLAIHDISCFGKCSTTIVLPILAISNIATSILPTSLLSTHTGGLGVPFMRDGSKDMEAILHHWSSLSLSFDAIYTGYVSNISQIEQIKKAFAMFPDALHYVDPVMGDHGKLYASLPNDIVSHMLQVCQQADIITPNMTELHALLGLAYQEGPYTTQYIETCIKDLARLCLCDVVLTGVYFNECEIGCACYSAKHDEMYYAMHEKIDAHFHGTGDVFASSFLGALLHGASYEQASHIAITYTTACINESLKAQVDERYGVNFESSLLTYANLIRTI